MSIFILKKSEDAINFKKIKKITLQNTSKIILKNVIFEDIKEFKIISNIKKDLYFWKIRNNIVASKNKFIYGLKEFSENLDRLDENFIVKQINFKDKDGNYIFSIFLDSEFETLIGLIILR